MSSRYTHKLRDKQKWPHGTRNLLHEPVSCAVHGKRSEAARNGQAKARHNTAMARLAAAKRKYGG